tara:strand:+ start:1020 stop:1217 length:198 start_codon:yes stop_codon:yes gene_type:complete
MVSPAAVRARAVEGGVAPVDVFPTEVCVDTKEPRTSLDLFFDLFFSLRIVRDTVLCKQSHSRVSP